MCVCVCVCVCVVIPISEPINVAVKVSKLRYRMGTGMSLVRQLLRSAQTSSEEQKPSDVRWVWSFLCLVGFIVRSTGEEI